MRESKIVKIWRVKIGPQWSSDDIRAENIDQAIAKCKAQNAELLKNSKFYIDSAELVAESEY